MVTSEIALIDTNVLIYAADEASPFHKASKDLRDKAIKGEIELCLCPQILMEFYAILTDPKRVENSRKPKEVIEEIEKYLNSGIQIIYPKEDAILRVLHLLRKYKLKKQKVFDAFLVATMLSNGVYQVYTYNQEDFEKFEEIEVLIP